MQFTEDDVPLMKLIFNPSTHDMGMMVGRERAEEIFQYVCALIKSNHYEFINGYNIFCYWVLDNKKLCHFFCDKSILQFGLIRGYYVSLILRYSPVKEKIWDSGKLNLYLLPQYELKYFKNKFKKKKRLKQTLLDLIEKFFNLFNKRIPH